MAPVALNVVCFRYTKAELDDAALDKLNKQIEVELQERGLAVVSVTTIRGRCVLHMANTNHRSRGEGFDALVQEVIPFGKGLT